MKYQPHSYQQAATRYVIEHERCALLLDMGLGKTIITLSAIHDLVLDYFDVGRVLVIAPLRIARDTWPAEAVKWDHLDGLTFTIALGTPQQRREAINRDCLVTLINRENVPWLVENYGRKWPWDMIIIDESSSFKNHQAKRFKALRAVAPKTRRMVLLTGTPAANSLLDLWSQYRLLDGGHRLGRTITSYRDTYFTPDKRNGPQVYTWKPKPGADQAIYDAIGDITMSMRAADKLTLPPLTTVNVPVRLPEQARAKYQKLKDELVLDLPGGIVDGRNAAVLAGKLLQAASGTLYDTTGEAHQIHTAKLDALADLVEAANGNTLLVAYWYKSDLAQIQAAFPEARDLRTAQDMTDWNAGKIQLGLIHPAAAGHGLNLQAGGHHLVWYTPPWSLEAYQQTNARLYRQGQQSPVTIHHLLAAGTIDTQVIKALQDKNTRQANLIDALRYELKQHQTLTN